MHADTFSNIPKERNQSNCLLRLQQTYDKFKQKPLPPVFKTRIEGPSSEWKIFKRLQLAEEFADSRVKDCMIFSYEDIVESKGQRLFLVAHPMCMWSSYKIRPSNEKCSYEVIRENHPCKLYFDIEYYTAFNFDKDGILMTKLFIKCVIAAIFDFYNIEIQESDFLWLDSSNEEKYSCHLILLLKNTAFKNNYQAGIFVSKLLSSLRTRSSTNSLIERLWPAGDDIQSLFVATKNGNNIIFCDEAVYSKNRNFRLYLSTKHGKASPLLLSRHNLYVPTQIGKDRDEAIFYDSLLTYFKGLKITKLLSHEELSEKNSCSFSSNNIPNANQSVSSHLPSPFSNLDTFILRIIEDETAVGFIRKWKLITSEQKIIYDIGNFRFCHNIGRHHRSNNIRIVVDLKSRFYFQTCLDPECRFFQSEALAIPDKIAFVNVPDDFFEDIPFTQLPMEETDVKNCEPQNKDICGSQEILMSSLDIPDNLFDDDDFSSCEVKSKPKRECQGLHRKESINVSNESPADAKNESNSLGEDLCSLNDEFWNFESKSCDSWNEVSHEDEMLMLDAAETTEAVLNGNIFNEETIF